MKKKVFRKDRKSKGRKKKERSKEGRKERWVTRKRNKAEYTAIPDACGWAGAIFEVTSSFGQEQ